MAIMFRKTKAGREGEVVKLRFWIRRQKPNTSINQQQQHINHSSSIFDDFEIEVMRYGFSGLVLQEILEKLATRFSIDFDKLKDAESIQAGYMHNPLVFRHEQDRFRTKNLLLLGLLLCPSPSKEQAQDSLWALLVPSV